MSYPQSDSEAFEIYWKARLYKHPEHKDNKELKFFARKMFKAGWSWKNIVDQKLLKDGGKK